MVRVDVVVVTYNSSRTVRDAVSGLAGDESIHVVVVDNASSDSTVALLATLSVETIALHENRGFAHGCNVGAAAGSAPYVLLLNPDARIEPDAVRELVRELEEHPKAGTVAPRIRESGGGLEYSLRRFPRLRSTFAQSLFIHRVFPHADWVDEVIREPAEYDRPRPVEWVSGACLLVRRTVLAEIGGLDETYFHYGEDIDLCARIWEAGHEVRYQPAALATHDGGVSAGRSRLLPLLAASRIRYSTKHDTAAETILLRAGIGLGSVTHALVARGGWAARRGHLGSLAVALRPLPADPSRLVSRR